MAMPSVQRKYTVSEVRALPEDRFTYELIDGELEVSPTPRPRHERVRIRLMRLLAAYLDSIGVGDGLVAQGEVTWGTSNQYVIPDLCVVPPQDLDANDWDRITDLRLVVEIVSLSSARRDRLRKRVLYMAQRVSEYWIVDPDAEVVEVWQPAQDRPAIVMDELRWRYSPESPECVIDLPGLFRNLPANRDP
jgi:Uma2 family endonuclease